MARLVRASFYAECQRCPHAIVPGQQIVRQRGGWLHVRCASGGDE